MRVLLVVVSVLLLSSVFVVGVRSAVESGPITIMADGSITPSTAPLERAGSYYTLTADIISDTDGIWINASNIILDGDGHLIQANGTGIMAFSALNVTIKNLRVPQGISLLDSRNAVICGNTIGNIYDEGGHVTVYGNDIGHVSLHSGYDVFHNNNIDGVECAYGGHNVFYENNISTNGGWGISLFDAAECVFYNNTIRDNYRGVGVGFSSPAYFYNNNFINNTVQVSGGGYEAYPSGWNNEYPIGGNYWDDYNGTDLFSGPNQNETGSDGIGDTPYYGVCYEYGYDSTNLPDKYPLMQPMGSPRVYWNLCDVNYDLKVDMRDVGISAKAFGTVLGDALWNPLVDVTGPEPLVPDGKVDMRDISLVASHYGERYA